jgi:uncharacterized repeat protein (TIGR01451 family)
MMIRRKRVVPLGRTPRRLAWMTGALCASLAAAALLPATALAPADLSITKSDSPDPVTAGEHLTYTIEVQNLGPDPAPGVTVTDNLDSQVDPVSATPTQGSCDTQGKKVTCALGTLASGATATVTIVVTPKNAGTITNTAAVESTEPDPQSANNQATAQTTVQEAPKPGKPPKGPSCRTATPTIVGTEGDDTLVGTERGDVIFALGGNDSVAGLGGSDLICGGSGNDALRGQASGDTVKGGSGNDNVKGGGGNDKLGGGVGGDRLGGGRGGDFLNGGPGRDFCNGGPGKDVKRSC